MKRTFSVDARSFASTWLAAPTVSNIDLDFTFLLLSIGEKILQGTGFLLLTNTLLANGVAVGKVSFIPVVASFIEGGSGCAAAPPVKAAARYRRAFKQSHDVNDVPL